MQKLHYMSVAGVCYLLDAAEIAKILGHRRVLALTSLLCYQFQCVSFPHSVWPNAQGCRDSCGGSAAGLADLASQLHARDMDLRSCGGYPADLHLNTPRAAQTVPTESAANSMLKCSLLDRIWALWCFDVLRGTWMQGQICS